MHGWPGTWSPWLTVEVKRKVWSLEPLAHCRGETEDLFGLSKQRILKPCSTRARLRANLFGYAYQKATPDAARSVVSQPSSTLLS